MRIRAPNPAHLRAATLAILIVMCTLLILSAVFPFPEGTWGFLSIGMSQKVYANPDWLSGFDYRQQLPIIGAVGAGTNYTMGLDVYYDNAPIADNAIEAMSPSNTRPALYYEGTYNRTYFGYYVSSGAGDGHVKLRYFDEDIGEHSDEITLWDDWGYFGGVLGDDHCSPSVIVLEYQTGDYTEYNGTILVAAAEHGSATANQGRLQVRRSTYPEFNNSGSPDTSFESAVSVRTTGASYANLVELDNGTLMLFYRLSESPNYPWYYYTSTDAGDTWDGPTELYDRTGNTQDYCAVVESPDHSEVHAMFEAFYPGVTYRHQDIYYACFNGTTWVTVNGTELALPLDGSTPGHIPDLVYETDDTEDEEDWSWLADISTDSEGNPYLLFINWYDAGDWVTAEEGVLDLTGYVMRANYGGSSWVIETVGTSGQFGEFWYPAGATFDPSSVDTVYATPYATGTTANTQLEKYQRISDVWTDVAHLADSSADDIMRPLRVRQAGLDNPFRMIYCRTASYVKWEPGDWTSALYGYNVKGSNVAGNDVALCGHCQPDFDDVRFTDDDGSTELPYWLQTGSLVEGLSATFSIKVADNVTSNQSIYIYYGNDEATTTSNGDDTFLFFDDFPGSLDGSKWTTITGSIITDSGELELEGTTGTRGEINSKTTIAIGAEVRTRTRSDTNDAFSSNHICSLHKSGDWLYRLDMFGASTTYPNRLQAYTGDGSGSYDSKTNYDAVDISTYHIYRATWISGEAKYYENDNLIDTHTAHVPSPDLVVAFQEGGLANYNAWIDWVFVRNFVDPEPTWGAWGEEEAYSLEITNTPDNYGFGTLGVNTTGSTTIDYFTITNTGNANVDVVIYGTDAAGGDDTWDLDDTGTPGENIYGLYAGLDDDDDLFDVIVRETETYNTLLSDLAEDATQDWGLKIYMPTSVTDYDAQQMSATITLVASASS